MIVSSKSQKDICDELTNQFLTVETLTFILNKVELKFSTEKKYKIFIEILSRKNNKDLLSCFCKEFVKNNRVGVILNFYDNYEINDSMKNKIQKEFVSLCKKWKYPYGNIKSLVDNLRNKNKKHSLIAALIGHLDNDFAKQLALQYLDKLSENDKEKMYQYSFLNNNFISIDKNADYEKAILNINDKDYLSNLLLKIDLEKLNFCFDVQNKYKKSNNILNFGLSNLLSKSQPNNINKKDDLLLFNEFLNKVIESRDVFDKNYFFVMLHNILSLKKDVYEKKIKMVMMCCESLGLSNWLVSELSNKDKSFVINNTCFDFKAKEKQEKIFKDIISVFWNKNIQFSEAKKTFKI